MSDKKNIEDLFEEIEDVIDQLENPDVTLEESFSQYQQGLKILKQCNDKIDGIEKEMIVLSKSLMGADE